MINIEEINKLISYHSKVRDEQQNYVWHLEFIKDKLVNGSEDEKKIIIISAKLTMDSINALMNSMRDKMKSIGLTDIPFSSSRKD